MITRKMKERREKQMINECVSKLKESVALWILLNDDECGFSEEREQQKLLISGSVVMMLTLIKNIDAEFEQKLEMKNAERVSELTGYYWSHTNMNEEL